MTTSAKELYSYIGLLSVKFALMENNLLALLGHLVVQNDQMLTATIFERNNLTQNIELIKKINKFRDYEPQAIKNLLERIGHLQQLRNLFIHGIWGEPFEAENDIMVVCKKARVQYEEDELNRTWTSARNYTFAYPT